MGLNFRAIAQGLLPRAQLSAMLNKTFGGTRDMNTVLGYLPVITPADYWYRYRRGGIAKRIVEAAPKATWRGGGELVEDPDPNNITQFELEWFELDQRLQIWSTFLRADILAGLGEFSVVFLGLPGLIDQPVENATMDQLIYLQPYSQKDVTIEKYITNPQDPRFGQIEFYGLKRLDPNNRDAMKRVHWSRVIHVPSDGLLDDHVFGIPRLECVWNDLDDLYKVSGGGAEAFWMRANQGMQLDIDPTAELEAPDADKMKEEVTEYEHGLRRTMYTRGVKIQSLGSDVADFQGPTDSKLKLISGATGIPQRLLTGSEMGSLASTQDRSNWQDRITDRRSELAGPHIVRVLVDRLISIGVLSVPAEYEVRWPQIQYLSEQERADVAVKWADINSKYEGELVITPDEIRDHLLELPPISEVAEDYDPVIQDPSITPLPRVAAKRMAWRKLTHSRVATLRNQNGRPFTVLQTKQESDSVVPSGNNSETQETSASTFSNTQLKSRSPKSLSPSANVE